MPNALERRNRELLALHRAGLTWPPPLAQTSSWTESWNSAQPGRCPYGALSVIDQDGHIKEFITSGNQPPTSAPPSASAGRHGVLGVVLHGGQHLRLGDVAEHPQSQGFPANHPVMRSLLAVPVSCKSPFRGNIYLSEKAGGTFSDDDEETWERFAVQASIAIDNAHLHAQAAEIATARERCGSLTRCTTDRPGPRICQHQGPGGKRYLRRGKTEEASTPAPRAGRVGTPGLHRRREAIVGLRTLPENDRHLVKCWRVPRAVEGAQWREHGVCHRRRLRLRATVELQVVRIVQEALTNVRKTRPRLEGRVGSASERANSW